ncbi:CBS domain-containing protein [Sorangium sp. So ce1000]|uniref:CBS domain-containing protein n=1 Tax=Sorangium sp. So ce1000 TaxID=3133325 RepID=UPI003F5D90CD
MKWVIRITRLGGVEVVVHAAFGLLLPIAALQWGARHGGSGALFGCALGAALLGCVALQALVHGIVARQLGLRLRELQLSPLGPIASRSRSAAGWAQGGALGLTANVALASLFFVAVGAQHGAGELGWSSVLEAAGAPSRASAIVWIASANLGIALLGLLPALPLEGGRVLREALSPLVGAWLATSMAAALGQATAAVLFLMGLFGGQLVVAALSALLFLEARREWNAAQAVMAPMASTEARPSEGRAVQLWPGELVGDAARRILASHEPDFPVVYEDRVIGIVTRNDVMRALASGEEGSFIAWIMRCDVPRVAADVSLDEVGRQMIAKNTPVVAVFDGDSYLGLVTHSDIAGALTRGRGGRLGRIHLAPQAG